MKSSEALRKARKLIESGECSHVCYALNKVRIEQDTYVQSQLLKLFGTDKSLSDYWYSKNNRNLAQQVNPYVYKSISRKYRLAWIDWMIEGYEAVGD